MAVQDQALEQKLNYFVQGLYEQILGLAPVVREGDKEQIAQKLELMAMIICEHWPNCFETNLSPKKTS